MSWLSQGLEGDFSWVGGHNTLEQLGIVGGVALGGLGLAGLAGLGPAAGLLGAGEAGAAGAGEAAAAGAPLDLLSFGSAAGTAVPGGVGTIEGATGALTTGLATEPGFAATAAGGFAPGLDTTAAGIFGGEASLPFGATPTAFTGPGVSTTGAPNAFDSMAIGGTPSGGAGAAPAAPGGASVAAPAGVTSPLGADPTAALGANAPSPLDTAAYPAGPVGAPGSSGGGFLSSIGKAITPDFSKPGSLIGPAIAAGGLGYNIMQGQKQTANVQALEHLAATQGVTGAQLEQYLTSGTLPPGLKASVDQAVQSAKTNAISNAASRGQPTDPRQNTALAAELAKIDQQTPILTAQIGEQLLSSGISASGLSSQIYTTLAGIDQTQTAAIGKAIANMSAALAGRTNVGGTNITLKAA